MSVLRNKVRTLWKEIETHLTRFEAEGRKIPEVWKTAIDNRRRDVHVKENAAQLLPWLEDMNGKITKYAGDVEKLKSWRAELQKDPKGSRLLTVLDTELHTGVFSDLYRQKLEEWADHYTNIVPDVKKEATNLYKDASVDYKRGRKVVDEYAREGERFARRDIDPEARRVAREGERLARKGERYIRKDIIPEARRVAREGERYVRKDIIPEAERLGREGERLGKEGFKEAEYLGKEGEKFIRKDLIPEAKKLEKEGVRDVERDARRARRTLEEVEAEEKETRNTLLSSIVEDRKFRRGLEI